MADKVAVVNNKIVYNNRGIGYATVKELCKRGVGYVYLTTADVKRGQEAVKSLNKEGFKPLFHQLDVTDKDSVKVFAEHLKQKHGGLDILINNAALITSNFTEKTYEDSVLILNANYYSILTIQEHIFPILKDNARVINMSSYYGPISNLKIAYWISRLEREDIKLDDINAFVERFLESVKNGTLNEEDFAETPYLAYKISKIAVSALTRVQRKQVERGISINSTNPEFVKTDLARTIDLITTEKACKALVNLALDIYQLTKVSSLVRQEIIGEIRTRFHTATLRYSKKC